MTKPTCTVEMLDNGVWSSAKLDPYGNVYKFVSSAKLSIIGFKRMFNKTSVAEFRIVSL